MVFSQSQIYAFGGYEHQQDFKTSTAIEEFDPVARQWTQLSVKLSHAR